MSDDQRQRFPRLAISDLLVLTLCVGFALGVAAPLIRSMSEMPDEMFRGSRLTAIAVPVSDHLGLGLNLFGLTVLTRERLRSMQYQLSPGHWYFLVTGPGAVFL